MLLCASQGFQLNGTSCETLALFDVLDPKDSSDYIHRVEPSSRGGDKMGAAILKALYPTDGDLVA